MDSFDYPWLSFRLKPIAKFSLVPNALILALGSSSLTIFPVAIANPSPPHCAGIAIASASPQQSASKTQKLDRVPRPTSSQSPPNLWWAREQYDPFEGRLIDHWQVDRENHQISVIVNRQLWASLDYLGRYRLVSQLGSVARESRYNLSVLNPQNKCLATYFCQFEETPYQCEVAIEPFNRPGIAPQRPLF